MTSLQKEITGHFATLSDPNRLSVYLLLMECCRSATVRLTPREAEAWIDDASKNTRLTVETITGHLAVLKRAGLVHVTEDSKTVDCRFDTNQFNALAEVFKTADKAPSVPQSPEFSRKGDRRDSKQ